MPWKDHPYRVSSNRLLTPVIRELLLAADEEALGYEPGQYVLLCDRDHQVPQRSYSVANAPRPDGTISLLVTRVPHGPTSGWVHGPLPEGSAVVLNGPYGTFVPDEQRSGPVLLLAAGSGLAPARAIAEALLAAPQPRAVTLLFSARSSADTIDHARWLQWANTRSGFRYRLTLTREPHAPEQRRIPDLLPGVFDDLGGWEVFASGPSGFVTACADVAVRLGAERAAVHTEEFFTDPQPWTGRAPEAAGQGVPP